ncbi:MAG TPA: HAD-IA family hydrolase [Gemmatimonadaceae bacterium]|nr:HAD-IA family hydrolase [Gemmatimonadaceae bacterium]
MRLLPGTVFDVDAVLLDMDGTLVDSTAVVVRLWRSWAARHGVDAEAILAVSHGRRGDEVVAEFAPPGVDRKAELEWLAARELIERDDIVAVPGAAELLSVLPPDCAAVVTSATRELTAVRMRAAGLRVPNFLVGADDVVHGKPHPEGYTRAAALLGVDPAHCLVVEDAPAGLEAGRAAGARVIAVATTLSPRAVDAWDWVPDLTALRIADTGARGRRLRVTTA